MNKPPTLAEIEHALSGMVEYADGRHSGALPLMVLAEELIAALRDGAAIISRGDRENALVAAGAAERDYAHAAGQAAAGIFLLAVCQTVEARRLLQLEQP